MKGYEEVHADELAAGTHVMSGRWVDEMKNTTGVGGPNTQRGVTRNLSVTKVVLRQQQHYRASVCSWQDVSIDVIRDTKLLWQTTTQAFLNAEVRDGVQLNAQPPEELVPKLLLDGRCVVWKVRNAMLGLRRRICETN